MFCFNSRHRHEGIVHGCAPHLAMSTYVIVGIMIFVRWQNMQSASHRTKGRSVAQA